MVNKGLLLVWYKLKSQRQHMLWAHWDWTFLVYDVTDTLYLHSHRVIAGMIAFLLTNFYLQTSDTLTCIWYCFNEQVKFQFTSVFLNIIQMHNNLMFNSSRGRVPSPTDILPYKKMALRQSYWHSIRMLFLFTSCSSTLVFMLILISIITSENGWYIYTYQCCAKTHWLFKDWT